MNVYTRHLVGGALALVFVIAAALLDLELSAELQNSLITGAMAYLFGREAVSATERKTAIKAEGRSTTVLGVLLLPMVLMLGGCGASPVPAPQLEKARVVGHFDVTVSWFGFDLQMWGTGDATTNDGANAEVCVGLGMYQHCWRETSGRVIAPAVEE